MSPQFEASIRLAAFMGVLLLLAALELWRPRRALFVSKGPRWASNLALVAINTLAARVLLPITAVGAAALAEANGWGLLNQWSGHFGLKILIAVIALDLAIYFQHVLFHAVPLFWRLHKVHHADLDFDVTTGLRFHTLEILLSAWIKIAAVLFLGAAPLAVVVFEVVLNATSMFNHSNLRLPLALDRWLRLVLVTPDMHRVHHSVLLEETNSNFGFSLPWWDFLCGTYRGQPQQGHELMTIGLAEYRAEREADRLDSMLQIPFRPVRDSAATAASTTSTEPAAPGHSDPDSAAGSKSD